MWHVLSYNKEKNQQGTRPKDSIPRDNKLGLGYWPATNPRHPDFECLTKKTRPNSPRPYPSPVFRSPRTRKFREPRKVVPEEDKGRTFPDDPAVHLEPTTSEKGKDKEVKIITGQLYHVPTLQGSHPLDQEPVEPRIMESIERHIQGGRSIRLEGTPAAAISSTNVQEPTQANRT